MPSNYSPTIYLVLDVISDLEITESLWEHVCRLNANTMPSCTRNWESMEDGVHRILACPEKAAHSGRPTLTWRDQRDRTKQPTAHCLPKADTDCSVTPAVLLTGRSPSTEPLPTASHRSERKHPARGLQAPGYNCINQSIYNFFFCILLFEDTLFNIYCWFINFELMANSTITGTWKKLI